MATRPPISPKKFYRGGCTNRGHEQRSPNNKHPKCRPFVTASRKPHWERHQMSPPASTLLERIGHVDEAPSESDMSVSPEPHFYTPEPDEVDRFLESVIGAPAAPPSSLSGSPPLVLGTHNLSVKVEDTASLYSPTSSSHSPFMQPSTMDACKKHLAPVLAASAQARGTGGSTEVLSDDHCGTLMQKAKEMRQQLSSIQGMLSEKAPLHRGSLKRDRVDEVGAWVRNTRNRFNSVNTVATDVSRRDSDTTLVDPGRSPTPKAPRAMRLQWNNGSDKNTDQAPCPPLVTSLTTTTSLLIESVNMPHQPTIEMDATITPVEDTTSEHPTPVSSTSPDVVSHLPTQPGIWFTRQGERFAEIVDVEFEVSDGMFHVSSERLLMHLRLRSVLADAGNNDTPQDVTERTCQWPKKGKLVVQVNPDSERSKTWLPYALTSDPLDVTACIRPGKNLFRFIQLSDLSAFTFVLVASPLPPEEEWRSWDWVSLVDARARSSSSADGLSEFAQVPITVRS